MISTAKRLCSLAQGCSVARLPWDRIVEEAQPQPGLRPTVLIKRISQSITLNRLTTVPETDTTQGWGWISLDSFTQGSRAARQPWVKLHNRFAVQIKDLT